MRDLIQENHDVITSNRHCQLLYNAELLKDPAASLLSQDILQQADSIQQILTGGRGQAWFLTLESLQAVLRAYQRGGLIARINQQSYWGVSAENSRGFKEWRLLQWMLSEGLPVPLPIAASFCRWPFFLSPFYRAHILVERIDNTRTLDQLLSADELDEAVWESVGQCIAGFHNKGVYHADLNANNILLDDQSLVYLIDFDKGEIRQEKKEDASWKRENLSRLQRSLLKQRGKHQNYYYDDGVWGALIRGYENNVVRL